MPRKTGDGPDRCVGQESASMRPRPDAAENIYAVAPHETDGTWLQ